MFAKLRKQLADETSDGSKPKPTKVNTIPDNQEATSIDDNTGKKKTSIGNTTTSPAIKSYSASSSSTSPSKFSFPDVNRETEAKEETNTRDDRTHELERQLENLRKSFKDLTKTNELLQSSLSKRQDANHERSRDTHSTSKTKASDDLQEQSNDLEEKSHTIAESQLSQSSRDELKNMKQQISSMQEKYKELEHTYDKEKKISKDKTTKLEKLEAEFESFKVKEASKKAELNELQSWQREEIMQLKQMLLKCQDSLLKAENGQKEATERLDKVTVECEAKRSEIKDLRACIDEITTDRDEFIRREKETKRNLREGQSLLDSYKQQVESLSKEVSSIRSSHANVEEVGMIERKRLQQEIVSKNSNIIDLEEKVKVLQQRLETAQLPDNDEKLQAVAKERDILEKQIEEIKQDFYQTNSKSDELVNSLTVALNRTKAELMQSETSATSSIGRLTKDIEEQKLNSQKLQEEAESEISSLKEKVETLQNDLRAREQALRETDSCNIEKTSVLEEKLAETEIKFRNLDKASTEKITRLQQQLNETETLLNNERMIAEQNLATWKSFCDEKDIDIENQKQLIEAIQNESTSLQNENSNLKQEVSRLKELIEESKDKINELEEAMAKKSQKISILKNANDAKESLRASEIETLKTKIADLDRSFQEQTACIKELELKLEELTIEKEVLSKGNDEREKAIDLLRKELAERDQQLNEKLQVVDSDASVKPNVNARKELSQKDGLSVAMLAVESKPFTDQFDSEMESGSTVQVISVDSLNQEKQSLQDMEAFAQENRDLQEQLDERNKTIKMQSQRLNDLKKALQKALKQQKANASVSASANANANAEENDPFSPDSRNFSSDNLSLHNYSENASSKFKSAPSLLDSGSQQNLETNFEYLKNVVYKFMSSSDSEAQHLVKVIATLLKFNKTEVTTVKRMMEYKMSWFRPKPSSSLHQVSMNSSRI
ncbi:Golgin subfamily A member 1 [Trichoplax sp. H2]|nr:Golgin subfamily A member 1 [Trichoplax sp. H2]|eukprot:RDD43351.1 Golgin subfamily A member 1 [Trichoplax sp. H2]